MSSSRLSWFTRAAKWASHTAGRPLTFIGAVLIILIWAILGPFFGFSDTWQLVINTSTTIVTFLMVFLIQHSENKNSKAIHLKLDELIAASKRASNQLIDLEESTDEDMERVHSRLSKLTGEGVSAS